MIAVVSTTVPPAEPFGSHFSLYWLVPLIVVILILAAVAYYYWKKKQQQEVLFEE
jgi:cytochrome c-type biogenesis protein CcmH/NrfG